MPSQKLFQESRSYNNPQYINLVILTGTWKSCDLERRLCVRMMSGGRYLRGHGTHSRWQPSTDGPQSH